MPGLTFRSTTAIVVYQRTPMGIIIIQLLLKMIMSPQL